MEKLKEMSIRQFPSDDKKWPTGLKSVDEAASQISIRPERLMELANGHFVPHFIIDDGPPLFQIGELKKWMAKNLLTRIEGQSLPIELKVIIDPPKASNPPPPLIQMKNLRRLPFVNIPSGIYFLVDKEKIIYIGQSVNIPSRLQAHKDKNFDNVYMLPIPQSALNPVEAALIRYFKPPLNYDQNQRLVTSAADDGNGGDEEILNKFIPEFLNIKEESGRTSPADDR